MSQKAVPIADVGTPTGWTTPVWSKTDELQPGDPDYTTSSSDPAGDTFTVRLEKLFVPLDGPCVLRVRAKRVGPSAVPVSVVLFNGPIQIASWFAPVTTTFETLTFALPPEAVSAFNQDFSQARCLISAGRNYIPPCSTTGYPTTLYAHFGGCFDGAPTIALTYNPKPGDWRGPVLWPGGAVVCGSTVSAFLLACTNAATCTAPIGTNHWYFQCSNTDYMTKCSGRWSIEPTGGSVSPFTLTGGGLLSGSAVCSSGPCIGQEWTFLIDTNP